MRPLKEWRYAGAYGPDVMACVGDVRIGFLRQRFWAVCERGRTVVERTTLGRGGVSMDGPRALVDTSDVRIDLTVEEDGGVETRHADEVWTRKQAGVPVRGSISVNGRAYEVGPVPFADDLSSVSFAEGGSLSFSEWDAREDHTNLLILRSDYRQPFGTFAGVLPGGVELAEGYGVMEWHDVRW